MQRGFFVSLLLGVAACGGSAVAPGPVYSSYFLTSVDGKALPAPYGGDGADLLAGGLSFDTPSTPTGVVGYRLLVRQADQSVSSSTVQLNYSISAGELRINLCPSLAICIASDELVGPIVDSHSELVLTRYVAGVRGSLYRFFPSLPD